MKKLVLTLGLACLFMVACNNTPKQPEQAAAPVEEKTEVVEEKHECPMDALKAEYANWETMTDEAKAELNKKACEMFAQMDAKMAEMEAEGKACCKEGKEECEKKMAEMMNVPVLGLVENMSYFICPDCGKSWYIYCYYSR